MPTPAEIQALVEAEARRQGVDPALAVAVARQESGMSQHAKSAAGAIGVMQLMPTTAARLGVDPTDVVQNIEGGVRYLKQMGALFPDSREKQLAAYNAGPGNVVRYKGVPPFKETQGFVASITRMLQPPDSAAAPIWAQDTAARLKEIDARLRLLGIEQRLDELRGAQQQDAAIPEAQHQAAAKERRWHLAPAASAHLGDPSPLDDQVQALQQRASALLQGLQPGKKPDWQQVAALVAGVVMPGIGGQLAARVAPASRTAALAGELAGTYLARRGAVAVGAEQEGTVGDVASLAIPTLLRGLPPVAKGTALALDKLARASGGVPAATVVAMLIQSLGGDAVSSITGGILVGNMPHVLRRLLGTHRGREALKNVLARTGGKLSPQALGLANAAVRQAALPGEPGGVQPGTVIEHAPLTTRP